MKNKFFRLSAACLLAMSVFALPALAEGVLSDGVLSPKGPVAIHQRHNLILSTALIMIAIIPVLIGAPWLAWRYRRKHSKEYDPKFVESDRLEVLMWGVPTVIVAVMAVLMIDWVKKLDPYKPLGDNPLVINVVGLDWKFLYIYPEQGVASIGVMPIETGRPVELNMTSDTVMQAWLVQELAGQVYSMPGMITKLNLQSDVDGVMKGNNAQFNGFGFGEQSIEVQSMSGDDFNAWVATVDNNVVLNEDSYNQIAVQGSPDDALKALGLESASTPMTLGDEDLFHNIVMRYMMGKPVTAAEQPGSPAFSKK